jgi:hypothetical protein
VLFLQLLALRLRLRELIARGDQLSLDGGDDGLGLLLEGHLLCLRLRAHLVAHSRSDLLQALPLGRKLLLELLPLQAQLLLGGVALGAQGGRLGFESRGALLSLVELRFGLLQSTVGLRSQRLVAVKTQGCTVSTTEQNCAEGGSNLLSLKRGVRSGQRRELLANTFELSGDIATAREAGDGLLSLLVRGLLARQRGRGCFQLSLRLRDGFMHLGGK